LPCFAIQKFPFRGHNGFSHETPRDQAESADRLAGFM